MSYPTLPETHVDSKDHATGELGKLEVLVGKDALELLAHHDFGSEWDDLYAACPWATIFQTHNFVTSWYGHYAYKHTPILVLSRYNGKLTGLLPLAQGISELGIAGAGGYDAYYHMWLSAPAHGEAFFEAALKAMIQRFPGQDICLKYIPHNVPMGWLQKNNHWRQHCVLRNFRRPLMNLHQLVGEQVLNRRRFKEKYNRLKRLGKVEFELIDDPAAFDAILDQLADQYDFRKAATLNIMPFRDDPVKRSFLMDLFRKGILLAAVLKVDGNIISGITATTGKDGWSHGAGINTHAPAYSRYSPGYMIIKLLGIALKDAGVAVYDITPGGHAYKDAHADEHDSLIELRVTSTYKALYLQQFYKVKEMLKAAMEKKGVDARQFRNILSNNLVLIKEKAVLSVSSGLNKTAPIKPTGEITNITPVEAVRSNTLGIERDSLKDILLYDPKGTGMTRWEFMKKAMMHYEAGFIPYTYCNDHQLLCLVWQAPQPLKSDKREALLAVSSLPAGAVILCGIYCHSAASDIRGQFIKEVAHKISNSCLYESIYLLENVDFFAQNGKEV